MIHPAQRPFVLRNGKIFGGGRLLACVPLISKNLPALLQDAAASAAEQPDLIEWRCDYYEAAGDPAAMSEAAKALREALGDIPILLTPRCKAEGGAAELDNGTKTEMLRSVCAAGCIDLVDIEAANDETFIGEVRRITAENGVRLVLSHHNFTCMPPHEELEQTLRKMERLGADVSKLALMPKNYHEVAAFADFLCKAKTSWLMNPVIASLMGDVGAVSRFAGGCLGTDMSFAAVTGVSGPGQMHIRDYRILNRLIEG